MRTKTKVWMAMGTILILIGCILFGGVMTMFGWNFSKLSTVQYETNTYEITNHFDSICINTDTAKILFLPSEDGSCQVVCREESNAKHSVKTESDTLVIQLINNRSWYDHIGIRFGSPSITIYLPKEEYAALTLRADTGNVQISNHFQFQSADISLSTGNIHFDASTTEQVLLHTSTGKIQLLDCSAGALTLSTTTGSIRLSNVACQGDVDIQVSTGDTVLTALTCQNLTSTGSTGDLTLQNVMAAERIHFERTTGDVKFVDSDAAEMWIQTSTGNVTGILASEKMFLVHTRTGRISVPKSESGGKCEITTTTGNIKFLNP